MHDLLYRPPGDATPPDDSRLSAAERRYAGKIFLGSVVGVSLFTGVVECLRAGAALSHFGAAQWAAGIVALGALRMNGAGAAFSAAGVGSWPWFTAGRSRALRRRKGGCSGPPCSSL